MENQFEVVLIGPVKHNGKRKNIGATIMVTADELRALVKAKAVAANELTQLDDPDRTAESKGDLAEQLSIQTMLTDEWEAEHAKLVEVKDELLKENLHLKEKLQEAEADKDKLAAEIAKADQAIEAIKAEMSEAVAQKADTKPAIKPATKTTRTKSAKS